MSRERRATGQSDASSLARSVLGRLDRGGRALEHARIVSLWNRIAGPDVSAHTKGAALREGELLVFVDSPVWATELAVLSEHYRTALNTELGKDVVGSVRFSVSRKVDEGRRMDAENAAVVERAEERVEPVPATPTEIAQLRHMVSAVKSVAVREAVMAAAIRNLEWRKGLEARNASQKAARRPTEG
jgi:hypothetical protein